MQSAASEPVTFLGSSLALYWNIQTSQNGFCIWLESHVVCTVRLSLLTAAVSSSDTCFCDESAPTTIPWNWDTNIVLFFFFFWKFMWFIFSQLLQTHVLLMCCLHTWRFRRCSQRKCVSTCVEVCLHFCMSWRRTGSAGLIPQIITFFTRWSWLSASLALSLSLSHTHTHTHHLSYPLSRRLQSQLDVWEERKIPYTSGDRTTIPRSSVPWPSSYTDYAIPAETVNRMYRFCWNSVS